jgi:hypothetical protein
LTAKPSPLDYDRGEDKYSTFYLLHGALDYDASCEVSTDPCFRRAGIP